MVDSTAFGVTVTAGALEQIGLFGALERIALESLARSLRCLDVAPGELIFREGDTSSEMYVVLHGEFEVLKNSKRGVDTRVALLGTGDWFGEMSILDVQPRSASVRSLAVFRLLVITTADLEALYRRDVKSYSLFVLNVARELSRRLRVTDGILAELAASMVDDVVAKRHGSST
ncbi:MAG TPA: cyclic nucleotide-binding domain-containing protein [Polyangiaceae bacterium]|nr:cyclic nucleotide-binding domain-containing protein [Polyangiaceae bacterium]